MATISDLTPEFFRKNHITELQLGLDLLHCNARCEFCYLPPLLAMHGGDTGKSIQDDSAAKEFLEAFVVGAAQAHSRKDFHVNLKGGEITSGPHHLDNFKRWHDQAPNLKFNLTTNGFRLNKHWIDFLEKSKSVVSVSLNGYDAESHRDRMHVDNLWPLTLKNIHASIAKIHTTLTFVLSPKTIEQHYPLKIMNFLEEEFSEEEKKKILITFRFNTADTKFSEEEVFTAHPRDESLMQAIREDLRTLYATAATRTLEMPPADVVALLQFLHFTPEEIVDVERVKSQAKVSEEVIRVEKWRAEIKSCPLLGNMYLDYLKGNLMAYMCCENYSVLGNMLEDPMDQIIENRRTIIRHFTQQQMLHPTCGESCFIAIALREQGWKKPGE